MPLTDGLSVSIPAGATVNVLIGRPLEFTGVPTVVRLLTVADALGLNHQFLINQGANQMVPLAAGTPVNVAAVPGAGPKDDEDTMIPSFSSPAGARNQLNVTNTSGGAIVFRYRALMAS
jgi:hypothetical protein